MHTSATIVFVISFLVLCSTSANRIAAPPEGIDWKKIRVLVYTKNGKGYVHGNIGAASTALLQMGRQYGFTVDTSSNPGDFSDTRLKKYNAIIFNNTNNDVFDTDEEKLAFMHYIQAGGGFVGLHSATGTERNWPWFKRLIGASFLRHAKHQAFNEVVIDKLNPSTRMLPVTWPQDDECYFFKEMNPDLHVLLVHDLNSLANDTAKPVFFGQSSPAAWCHEFDGGREWYTALGHDSATYFKPVFQQHILGGIEWVVGKNKSLDYSKAHAKTPTDSLPY